MTRAQAPMLKVRFKDISKDPFWITERVFSVGSSESNSLVLNDASIESHHAKLIRERDSVTLRDLSSSAGTYVNGQRITSKTVNCGDQISFGNITLEIIDPMDDLAGENIYWSLIGDSSWLAGQEFPLPFDGEQPLLIGRGKHCDIVFPGTHLSREHTKLTLRGSEIVIEDLKSANATYVNDQRITRTTVKPGDRIRLDVYSFRVFGPGIELHKAATRKQPALKEPPATAPKPSTTAAPAPKKRRKRPPHRDLSNLHIGPAQLTGPRTQLTNWLLAALLAAIIASVILRVLIS